jgi:hypothetical protein
MRQEANHMWTIEEIAERNIDQPQILQAILNSGAGTEIMLQEVAEQLETLGPPHVACFAKLAFPLAISPGHAFVIPTGRYATATVRFTHFELTLGPDRRIQYIEKKPTYCANNVGIGTQVIAFIDLWGRHRNYYLNYLSCVTASGLRNQQLNKSLYGKTRAPAGYASDTIDAHRFEAEANDAIALAFHYAMKTFINNYNIVAPDDLICPERDHLSGLFMMLAPGRVSYCARPDIPISKMLPKHWVPAEVAAKRIEAALRFGRRQFDRYQSQLLAMQRLARDGEPELAIIGCITAIEWFLNSFRIEKPADNRPVSIKRLKPKELSVVLPGSLWERLRAIADRRNNVVHGGLPDRRRSEIDPAGRSVSDIVEAGLEVYKEVQLQMKIGLLE